MMIRHVLFAVVIILVILVIAYAFAYASPRMTPETVVPRRVDSCSSAQDSLPADPDRALHTWSGQNNHNWTAADVPWDPDSRIQLTAAALTAGARESNRPVNPVTRIGITDRVLNWDNPYADDIASSPCSSETSVFELQAFQPGFMAPKANESTDDTPAQRRYYYQPAYWNLASGPYGGPYKPVKSCDDASSSSSTKETLRSRGNYRAFARKDQCLSGIGCGLGSTWIDPRFEPGPKNMFPRGDAIWAHGGHAGGPTFGSFMPSVYVSDGAWDRYVRGFGDGDYVAPAERE